jgi:hypothetical protein
MKKCVICKLEKPTSNFCKNKSKPDGLNGRCKECDKKRDLVRRRGYSIHKQCIAKLGNKCANCGFDDIRALQIDHINGGGKKEIMKYQKYYNWRKYYRMVLADTTGKYQCLCANCNWIKKSINKEGVK